MKPVSATNQNKYWVVFTGKTDIWWLKFLKKEFRHCFVLMNDGRQWISIDPLSAFTDIQTYAHIDCTYDLPQWLMGQGYHVINASINIHHIKPAPFMLFTCVEAIKRILGVHQRTILTPFQLYKFLSKQTSQTMKGEQSWVV